MLLPRKWALSLGLLAAVPSLTVAGPLDFLSGKSDSATQAPERGNQEVAGEIAAALGKAHLVHKDVEIEYLSGVATIKGQIQDVSQRNLVTKIVGEVPGVKNVDNQLSLMQPQVAAGAQKPPARPAGYDPQVAQAAHQAAAPGSPMNDPRARQPVQQVSNESSPANNQEVAQNIAEVLTSAGLSGFDIEIRYKSGVASLIGSVDSKEQVMRAHQAAASVPGVHQVLNQLSVNGQPVGPAMSAGRPGMPPPGYGMPQPRQQAMVPAGYGMPAGPGAPPQGYAGPPPGYAGPPQGGMPSQQMAQQQMVQQAQAMMPPAPGPGGPVPQYGTIQPAGHHLYNQPNMPNYAWPSYAAYDNSAAVTYPTQYDASAWPYIGPYYPYPQVPLGWRQSTLEWDDGSWSLRFQTRTDRWWWFLSPKNWH